MKKFILAVLLGLSSFPLAADEFFGAPRILSAEEVASGLDDRVLDMAWHVGEGDRFRFVTRHGEVYFELVFQDAFPDDYEEAQKELFLRQEDRFVYSYRWNKQFDSEINVPLVSDLHRSPNSESYLVCERRILEGTTPRLIEKDELISLIGAKSVLFYTGAGLSAASNVPTMDQLCDLLGFRAKAELFSSLKTILNDPQTVAKNIYSFHRACFFSPPTPAHEALKILALIKNAPIVTENLDYLHEQTGILPLRVDANYVRMQIDPAVFRNIDCVVCIGLSYDDKGFLAWYKKHHPQGKIIAIDLDVPSYLGDDDLLYQGDLQEVVPDILDKLQTR